jgi:glycosyltransferase involved in cell wall biosynthesis
MKDIDVSLIICCYNSETRIPETLHHISRLIIPKEIIVELIIVDNNSTDNTSEIALKTWSDLASPFCLNLMHEPKAGLAHARKAGVLKSKGSIGIFCDDDNWLSKDYLVNAVQVLQSNNSIGLLGGCSTANSKIELPPWFYKKAQSFAVGIQSNSSGDVTYRKYLWGAGLSFRIEFLKNIYSSLDPLVLGRTGANLSSGDDGEIAAWFIMGGYKLYYSEDLFFIHFIEPNRLTKEYHDKFFENDNSNLWDIYSNYLSARFFLINEKRLPLKILKYFRSLFRLVLFPKGTIKVIGMHKFIKQMSK